MSYKSIKTSALLTLSILTLIAYANPAVAITWSNNVRQLTDYPYFDGGPSIAQTSDGKIWVIWSRDINGYYILYYTTSSDSGATWSQATNLTAKEGVGNNVGSSIIESADSTIWVVWSSNGKRTYPEPPSPDFYMNATPTSLIIPLGGTDNSTITVASVNNFTDTVNLYASFVSGVTSVLDPTHVFVPPNETATSLLTVSVDSAATSGNYTLTVIGEPQNHHFIRGVDIALEITESGEATLSDALSSSLSASSSAAGGEGDYEIFYKTSNDQGATWSNDIQLTDNIFEDANPSIVQLANGTIIVVWQSIRNGNPDIFYTTTSDGISWSDEKPVTTYSGLDKSPSVIQAEDERIWVAWTSNRTGDHEIFYKTYDGLSWSSAIRLTYSTNFDTSPSLLQSIDEKIWIFWTSSETTPTATGDVYYMVSSDNGANWTGSIQFTTDDNEDSWPAVTQTSSTKIWVVWTSNRADQPDGNWEIYYKTSLVGDLNGDGVVDIADVSIFAQAYGFVVGEIGYSPDADINKDNSVDVEDLALVGGNIGST